MDKDCPAILDCKECKWFRTWRLTNNKTGQLEDIKKCSIDVLLEYLPQIEGSIEGLQTAVNETRNDQITLMRGLARHGIDEPLRMFTGHRKKTEEISDGLEKGNETDLLGLDESPN